MLEVRNLRVHYGSIAAVRGIDLDVAAGEMVTLIGANGAGKSTIARAIAGLLPYHGEIRFEGSVLRPNNAEHNLRAGIALVPEGRGILGTMTVEDNLLMGLYSRTDRAEALRDLGAMTERFPIIAARRHILASLLSGGEQQILAIARALLAKPKLLLLDEPSLGLAPKMSAAVFDLIASLRSGGLTIVLVEQKARQALKMADRAYLLETGRLVTSGSASELEQSEIVRDVFLGRSEKSAPTP
jgi:branched-chain amino acid transport system ATP-binding protein